MTRRLAAAVLVAWVLLALPQGGLLHAGHTEPGPAITQFVLRGGSNSVLGSYYQAGLGFGLAGGTLLVGATQTATLGLEPFVAYSRPWSLAGGWTLTLLGSYGDLGGDYRVDRHPEVTLSRSAAIAGTPFAFSLAFGAGAYTVRPTGVSGGRATVAPSLSGTFPLGPAATLRGSLGYQHYAYSDGGANGAWTGSVALALSPAGALSVTFTYLFQDAWGSSPLLFDALSDDHTLAGAVSLRLSPALSVGHSQTYSFISRSISARVYSASLSTPEGVSVSVSYDDVPRTLSFSLSFRR